MCVGGGRGPPSASLALANGTKGRQESPEGEKGHSDARGQRQRETHTHRPKESHIGKQSQTLRERCRQEAGQGKDTHKETKDKDEQQPAGPRPGSVPELAERAGRDRRPGTPRCPSPAGPVSRSPAGGALAAPRHQPAGLWAQAGGGAGRGRGRGGGRSLGPRAAFINRRGRRPGQRRAPATRRPGSQLAGPTPLVPGQIFTTSSAQVRTGPPAAREPLLHGRSVHLPLAPGWRRCRRQMAGQESCPATQRTHARRPRRPTRDPSHLSLSVPRAHPGGCSEQGWRLDVAPAEPAC